MNSANSEVRLKPFLPILISLILLVLDDLILVGRRSTRIHVILKFAYIILRRKLKNYGTVSVISQIDSARFLTL